MNTKMKIYYYFEVSKNKQKRLQFKGNRVTANQVITEIIKQNKGFDRDEIRIFDAQTDIQFNYNDIITRNTQLVVRRIQRKGNKQSISKGPANLQDQKQKVKEGKKKQVLLVDEKELTPEEKQQREQKRQRDEIESEKQRLSCQCGKLLIGAVIETNCGEIICGECFEKKVCPYCNYDIDDDCCDAENIRQAVNEFLEKYPEFKE